MTTSGEAHERTAEELCRELCREALVELDVALRLPPVQVGVEVDRVERLIARSRDALIGLVRGDPASPAVSRRRRALERVNATLSLIVGIEYPASGVQWPLVQQARDELAAILEAGLLSS